MAKRYKQINTRRKNSKRFSRKKIRNSRKKIRNSRKKIRNSRNNIRNSRNKYSKKKYTKNMIGGAHRPGAAQAADPLPSDWTTRTSTSTGKHYYYNRFTGQATFDRDDPMITGNFLKILKTGKVYELEFVNNIINFVINVGERREPYQIIIGGPPLKPRDTPWKKHQGQFAYLNLSPRYKGSGASGTVYNLEMVAGENVKEDVPGIKLPLALKILDEPDKSEEFFAKIFRHIPVFNQEWNGDDDTLNCGIMQSNFMGVVNRKNRYGNSITEQYMLLESGADRYDSVRDLYQWIRVNKDINIDRYVMLATEILWQIIGQVVCLQKYGVFFFDIKSKNILVMQKGNNVRVMLIDTGGFIYHMPTFLSKIDTLPNNAAIRGEIEGIKGGKDQVLEWEELAAARGGNTILTGSDPKTKKKYADGYLNICYLSDSEFPASLSPLFVTSDDPGFISPRTIEDGYIFNIFAISLLANEIVCRGKGTVRWLGLYWRDHTHAGGPIQSKEKEDLLRYLEKFRASSIFGILINVFIDNWNFFMGRGENFTTTVGTVSTNEENKQYLGNLPNKVAEDTDAFYREQESSGYVLFLMKVLRAVDDPTGPHLQTCTKGQTVLVADAEALKAIEGSFAREGIERWANARGTVNSVIQDQEGVLLHIASHTQAASTELLDSGEAAIEAKASRRADMSSRPEPGGAGDYQRPPMHSTGTTDQGASLTGKAAEIAALEAQIAQLKAELADS